MHWIPAIIIVLGLLVTTINEITGTISFDMKTAASLALVATIATALATFLTRIESNGE